MSKGEFILESAFQKITICNVICYDFLFKWITDEFSHLNQLCWDHTQPSVFFSHAYRVP